MLPLFYHPESETNTSTLSSTDVDFSILEDDVIVYIGAGISGFSLLGSSFVIISYIKFPRLRSFAFQLILMVAISDFIRAVSYILTPSIDESLCIPQAVLSSFSAFASLLWVGSIAFTIQRTLLWNHSVSINLRQNLQYHIFIWGISAVLTLLPFTTGDYETSDVLWCWITFQTQSGVLWALVCYYVPLWLMMCYLIYVYSKIWWMLKARPLLKSGGIDSWKPKHRLVTQRRMAVYPTIFFFAVVCTSMDRLYQLIWVRRNFGLALLHIIMGNLQGLLNAFAYGFTAAVRLEWIAYYCPSRSAHDHYVSFNEDWRGGSSIDLEPPNVSRDNINYDYQLVDESKSSKTKILKTVSR